MAPGLHKMGAYKFYTFDLILFVSAGTLTSNFKILHFIKALQTYDYKSVSVRFLPKFSVFSFSLFAWKVKESLFYGLRKFQPVLGASWVPMAQGLPKAGEGLDTSAAHANLW